MHPLRVFHSVIWGASALMAAYIVIWWLGLAHEPALILAFASGLCVGLAILMWGRK